MGKTEIPDLKEKLDFLLSHDIPRGVARSQTRQEITSRPRLAHATGLGSHTNFYTSHGGLSDRALSGIQRVYRIEHGSECWGEFAAGCAAEFAEEYKKLHPHVSEETATRHDDGVSRQRNRPTPVVLVEDTSAPSNKYQTELASVQHRFAQMEPVPGEVTLTFDLNCPPVLVEDECTGVKRGFLIFRCGDARTTKAEERTGYPNGLEIDGVRICVWSVDQNVPSWVIESIEGNNIGLIAKAPDKFIRIMNMDIGYVISVEFCAYVKDIVSTFDLSQSEDISAAKRKIKKRLGQLTLTEGEQSTSLLARAEMRFIDGEV